MNEMHIQLTRVNDAYHFAASNEQGNTVSIDAAPSIGGTGQGARPMELLVMGLGACSSIDILSILKKQRQEVGAFHVDLDAERDPEGVPSLFTEIRVRYRLEGDLDPAKVRRAIELSLHKYCSVAKILEQTASISYTFTLNGKQYAEE